MKAIVAGLIFCAVTFGGVAWGESNKPVPVMTIEDQRFISDVYAQCDRYGNRIYVAWSGAGQYQGIALSVVQDDCKRW